MSPIFVYHCTIVFRLSTLEDFRSEAEKANIFPNHLKKIFPGYAFTDTDKSLQGIHRPKKT